jgi:hypothetical protein
MKPDAPEGVRSLFRPIRTVVPGIDVCDQMPLLARHMDKVAVVRSVSHPSNNHEPSVYHMLTGRTNPTLVVPRNQRKRSDFPSVGSVVSYFSPARGMPASVTVPRPIGHDGVTYSGTHAGFLGPRHDPMEVQAAPNATEQVKHPVALPDDVNVSRLNSRRGLLGILEAEDRRLQRSRATEGLTSFHEQAFRMLASPEARRAFNIDLEPPRVRDRYGRNEYGESFLLARRLIEAGVRLVNVTWMYIFPNGRVSNVWDNHAGYGIHGAKTGYDLLRGPVCCQPLDQAYSALLEDLHDRGLLDETLVAAVGEFGRTPKITADGARPLGRCQSALLAGGASAADRWYGATDAQAAYEGQPGVTEDFLATIYYALIVRELRPATEMAGRTASLKASPSPRCSPDPRASDAGSRNCLRGRLSRAVPSTPRSADLAQPAPPETRTSAFVRSAGSGPGEAAPVQPSLRHSRARAPPEVSSHAVAFPTDRFPPSVDELSAHLAGDEPQGARAGRRVAMPADLRVGFRRAHPRASQAGTSGRRPTRWRPVQDQDIFMNTFPDGVAEPGECR